MIFIFIFFPKKKNQLQNNVYEIVSDINARQTLIDAKVLTLEERLLIIYEQIEQLPEMIKKTLLSNQHQRSSLPTLVENLTINGQNITVPNNNNNNNSFDDSQSQPLAPPQTSSSSSHHHHHQSATTVTTQPQQPPLSPHQQTQQQQQSSTKHTFLHPNDAACLSQRPSWSTSNISPSNPNYSSGIGATGSSNQQQTNQTSSSSGKHYLTPNVLQTTSFDT